MSRLTGVCASSTVENFHSPSKSAKGAESLGPFGFSYFNGCGGLQPPISIMLGFEVDLI
jgi:hypothetical protein